MTPNKDIPHRTLSILSSRQRRISRPRRHSGFGAQVRSLQALAPPTCWGGAGQDPASLSRPTAPEA